MTTKTMKARAVIEAQDRTGRVFSQVSGKMKALEGQTRLFGKTMSALGGLRSIAGPLGILGGGLAIGAAAKRFGDWDERLRRFQNTAEITKEQLGDLEHQVRGTARELGMSAEDVFGGPEKLIAGGMSYDEAMKRSVTIARVAKAYGAATAEIGDATLSLANNLKITGDQLPEAFDHIAVSTKQGQIEFAAFAKWLPTLSSRMQSLGVTGMAAVDTIGAVAQAARKTAGSDDEAMNNVANFLDKLGDPVTRKNLKKMGFDLKKTFDESRRSGKNFVLTMIDELDRLTEGDLFKSSDILGDRQARMGFLATIQSLKELKANMEAMRNSGGTVSKDLANVMDGPKAKIGQLKTSVENLTNSFLVLAAQGVPAIDRITKGIDNVNLAMEGKGPIPRLIEVIGNGLLTGGAAPQTGPLLPMLEAHAAKLNRDKIDTVLAEIDRRIQEADTEGNAAAGSINGGYFRMMADRKIEALRARRSGIVGARDAMDATNADLTDVIAARQRMANLRINNPGVPGATGSGLTAFGLGGPKVEPLQVEGEARVEIPPIRIDLNVNATWIDARIDERLDAQIAKMQLRPSNAPGSVGTSSPDVGRPSFKFNSNGPR